MDAEDEKTTVTWIKPSPDEGEANVKTKTILKVEENASLTDRSAIIWLAAGRLRFAVNVTQTSTAAAGIKILDGNNMPVTDLIFASSKGVTPLSQKLSVDWLPKKSDLSITTTAISANAFPMDVGAPETGTLSASTNRPKVYTIAPMAITEEELAQGGNPFIEKVSKVNFSTSYDASSATASITLRQICYNMVTDVKNSYELESQQETLNVKANFDWKITDVKDEFEILQNRGSSLKGKTGGTIIQRQVTIYRSPWEQEVTLRFVRPQQSPSQICATTPLGLLFLKLPM
ncbi:MAG: hypothetical protein LUD46_07015 [Parabacteroides sp.]|nr:hypothetical protein [Parabacteroides sp.]